MLFDVAEGRIAVLDRCLEAREYLVEHILEEQQLARLVDRAALVELLLLERRGVL
jgi:hypothetical protein